MDSRAARRCAQSLRGRGEHEWRDSRRVAGEVRVDLRPFETPDIALLATWAKRIGADAYMSRTRPARSRPYQLCPEAGLLWYVVRVDGKDVGTIWLEQESDSSCASLGVLLGDEALFGHGIGNEAVRIVIERARAGDLQVRTLTLHVRRGNSRAIACYEKCGFATVGSGRKLLADGAVIEFLRMERSLDE